MAGIVDNTINKIDVAILEYGGSIFISASSLLQDIMTAALSLTLITLIIKNLFRNNSMPIIDHLYYIIGFVIVLSFGTYWENFEPIYWVLTQFPYEYAGAALSDTNEGNAVETLDDIIFFTFTLGERVSDQSSWYSIELMSLLVWVIACALGAVSIFVIGVSKLILAICIGVAPIFICFRAFAFTTPLFNSWVRYTLGTSIIPLIILMNIVFINYLTNELVQADLVTLDGKYLGNSLITLFISVILTYRSEGISRGITDAAINAGSGLNEFITAKNQTVSRSAPIVGAISNATRNISQYINGYGRGPNSSARHALSSERRGLLEPPRRQIPDTKSLPPPRTRDVTPEQAATRRLSNAAHKAAAQNKRNASSDSK